MNIQKIIKLYNEGKSLSFIANKYNTYGAKIKSILKKEGVRVRGGAERNSMREQAGGKKITQQ